MKYTYRISFVANIRGMGILFDTREIETNQPMEFNNNFEKIENDLKQEVKEKYRLNEISAETDGKEWLKCLIVLGWNLLRKGDENGNL